MHISEGMISLPLCIGGYTVAAGLVALALKKTKPKDIPKISVMGACFFVESLIHIKVGGTSQHLAFIGLVGLVLGFGSVLAITIGLFFQAMMFQHGGLSTLGLNICIMAVPALLCHLLFLLLIKRGTYLSLWGGVLASFSYFCAISLVALVLLLSANQFKGLVLYLTISQGVLAFLEGIITYLILSQILRIKPELISGINLE